MTFQTWLSRRRSLVEPALVVLTVSALGVGGMAWLAGWRALADRCWIAGTVVAAAPAVWWVVAALRRGRLGVRCFHWSGHCGCASIWRER